MGGEFAPSGAGLHVSASMLSAEAFDAGLLGGGDRGGGGGGRGGVLGAPSCARLSGGQVLAAAEAMAAAARAHDPGGVLEHVSERFQSPEVGGKQQLRGYLVGQLLQGGTVEARLDRRAGSRCARPTRLGSAPGCCSDGPRGFDLGPASAGRNLRPGGRDLARGPGPVQPDWSSGARCRRGSSTPGRCA